MPKDEVVRKISTAVLVVCLATFVVSAGLVLSPRLRDTMGVGPATASPAYVEGDAIDVPGDIFRERPLTLIVFGRSTCAACQASVPAYHAAVAAAAERSIDTWLVTPLPDLAPERAFATALGIETDRVVHVSPSRLRLQTVPTLVVVDGNGRIQHVWSSTPDATRQVEIIETLRRLGGTGE